MPSPRISCLRRVWLLSFVLFPLAAQPPVISPNGVVNAADFQRVIAPGMIVSIFGVNLAPGVASAETIPLPTELAGVSVELVENGLARPLPLFFVSTGQINAQFPFDLTGTTGALRVRNAAGVSLEREISWMPAAPRLFTATADGAGEATILHLDYSAVSVDNPALANECLILYLTGMGAVSPPVAAGAAGGDGGSIGPLSYVPGQVEVLVGGSPSPTVSFAGLAPYFAGLYQVNFLTPPVLQGPNQISVHLGEQESQGDVFLQCALDWSSQGEALIDPTGGSLSAGGLEIHVPAGGFAAPATLTVLSADAPPPLGDGESQTVFGILGLPDSTGPIEVSFPWDGSAPGDGGAYLWFQEPDGDRADHFVPVTLQNGRAVASLPGRQGSSSATSASLPHPARAAGTVRAALLLPRAGICTLAMYMDQFAQYSDQESRFEIFYGTVDTNEEDGEGLLALIRGLARRLDDWWDKLTDMGFRFPSGRIAVSVTSRPCLEAFGDARYSQWTGGGSLRFSEHNYFDPDWSVSKEQSAHLLFHLAQQILDPNILDPRPVSWLWMDEAVASALDFDACWSEVQLNSLFPLDRGLEYPGRSPSGSPGEMVRAREHGYGASLFIKHLEGKLGSDGRWFRQLQDFRNQATADGVRRYLPVEALLQMNVDVSSEWLQFAQRYIQGDFGLDGCPGVHAQGFAERALHSRLTFTSSEQTTASLSSILPDLSMQLAAIEFKEPPPDESKLAITVSGGPALIHRVTREQYGRRALGAPLAVVAGRCYLADPAELARSGDVLVVTMINNRVQAPYTGRIPFTVTAEIEPRTFLDDINWIQARLSVPFKCTLDGDDVTRHCPLTIGLTIGNEVRGSRGPRAEVAWGDRSFHVESSLQETLLGEPITYEVSLSGTLSQDLARLETATFRLRTHRLDGDTPPNPVHFQQEFTVTDVPIQKAPDGSPMLPGPGYSFQYRFLRDDLAADPAAGVTGVGYRVDYTKGPTPLIGTPDWTSMPEVPVTIDFQPR